MFGKIVSGVLGGLIVATLGSFVVTIAGAGSDPEASGEFGAKAFFVIWALSIVIAVMAKGAGKAWRRLMLTSAVLSFLLPLASFIFSGAHVAEVASTGGEHAGAAAAGAAIGGGLITMISGFLGFFLGIIFLLIGLLVGRDKQVIVVKESEVTSQ